MAQGNYEIYRQYISHPNINKSIEEIYADLDAYTYEIDRTESDRFDTVSFYVVLPPLNYQGKVIKGFYLSESVDLLNKVLPQLSQYFFSLGYAMGGSYSWSRTADAYSCLYKNPQRIAWFRRMYPDRKNKAFIPLDDTDFLNEYVIAPRPVKSKDIDVLCVARLSEEKNMPMIAKALKVYRHKYPEQKIMMTWIMGDKSFNPRNIKNLSPFQKEEWDQIVSVLDNPFDYIKIIPFVDYYQNISEYYSRSKVYVLGSLIEGKNRSVCEAMSCNVPVICFREFNQYARGQDLVFPEGAGLYAQFEPESLADTIHTVLRNPAAFKPRLQYLKYRGRKNFFNACLDSLPEYKQTIPDYVTGDAFNNLWLDLAVQDNYQMSLYDFLYGRSSKSHIRGLINIYKTLQEWLQL
ncbi:MAG: glycosyltransferase [Microcoleaceae cyanobacterium]